MSNEPPPPYPGGPTAPLLEEKSGAPPTPGRVQCLIAVPCPFQLPGAGAWSSALCRWLEPSELPLPASLCLSLSRPHLPSCDAAPTGHVTAPCRHWSPTL